MSESQSDFFFSMLLYKRVTKFAEVETALNSGYVCLWWRHECLSVSVCFLHNTFSTRIFRRLNVQTKKVWKHIHSVDNCPKFTGKNDRNTPKIGPKDFFPKSNVRKYPVTVSSLDLSASDSFVPTTAAAIMFFGCHAPNIQVSKFTLNQCSTHMECCILPPALGKRISRAIHSGVVGICNVLQCHT